MDIHSELCHIEAGRAIVRCEWWVDQKRIGSALGEGENSELAEDRAIQRLIARYAKRINPEVMKDNKAQINFREQESQKKASEVKLEGNKSSLKDLETIDKNIEKGKDNIDDREDWSEDLANLDFELKRLGWSKEKESIVLNRLFGYNSRIKLTNHKDLILLIKILKDIETGTNIDHVENNYNIDTLIEVNNRILSSLGWDHKKARDYLQQQMGVKSRKEMTIKDMIRFNNQLHSLTK